MPIPRKFYGDRPTITGDRQVAQQPATKAALPPINTDRWFRNGKHPDASAQNEMNAHLIGGTVFRTKEYFSIPGSPIANGVFGPDPYSAAGSRPRWRFAFHSGPAAHAMIAMATMYPPSNGFANDIYSTLKIYSDVTESTLVASQEFHYGPNPAGANVVGGWQYHRTIAHMITGIDPDTDYYGVWTDEPYCRLLTACAAELASMTENGYGGYPSVAFTEQTPLLDVYREQLASKLPALWKRGGSKVLQWSANIQASPRTIAVSTPTNLLDSSTTYGSSVAGYTLDMTGKARLSQSSTGVPIVLKAWASTNSATGAGRVYLKDSTGATIASIVDGWTVGGAGKWQSATGTIPATTGRYFLAFDNNSSGTLSVGAVSVYEYEA